MPRPHSYRLIFALLVILISATVEILRERRPSFLRPDLRLYAYVGNSRDVTGSVVDLIRLGTTATTPVVPSPSGLRAHPKLAQIWGVSTDGGYAFVIDAPTSRVVSRIPGGAAPLAIHFC